MEKHAKRLGHRKRKPHSVFRQCSLYCISALLILQSALWPIFLRTRGAVEICNDMSAENCNGTKRIDIPRCDPSNITEAKSTLKTNSERHATNSKYFSVHDMDDVTARILGPDEFGKGCPPGCGCPDRPEDCPRHYAIEDIRISATALLSTSTSLHFAGQLKRQHAAAVLKCKLGSPLDSGGWCLGTLNETKKDIVLLGGRHFFIDRGRVGRVALPDGRRFSLPRGHVAPSQRIGTIIVDLFRKERVNGISDFGAGVGQYGAYLKERLPGLVYYGYDGAGDVESYTQGFVRFADFTLPLDLPVTEWVLSLEVGEHVPSKFEGMFVRNLHRHNCAGVMLSWGVLGQGGTNHVNDHSNEYVAQIFDDLGYGRDIALEAELRNPEHNHRWFTRSVMVFRRNEPNCGGDRAVAYSPT